MFSFFSHQRACASKQKELQDKIDAIPPSYFIATTHEDQSIYALSLSQLVSRCQAGVISPSDVMLAYSKRAIRAHQATNCLSDIMFQEALATPTIVNYKQSIEVDLSLGACPLMGVPISIKDTIDIAGHDSTIGYSCNVGKPVKESSPLVRLLQDAGALIHAKTTVPTGLFSLETESDVFGYTTNPYNPNHTVGASSGGGAALLASGGCRIDIGSDIAGSIRIPAHFCGFWSLKGSAGRFPSWGNRSSFPGFEAISLVVGPMATSLDDLEEFWKRVIEMKPWKYDHTCVPLRWRSVDLETTKKRLKFGVVWENGIVPPSPACRRALSTVINALRKQGHEVIEFEPPSVLEGLKIGFQLIAADGGKQLRAPLQGTETAPPPMRAYLSLLELPKLVKSFLSFIYRSRILSFIFGFGSKPDPLSADINPLFHKKTVLEERQLVEQRDIYCASWHKKWAEDEIDFVLTPSHPLPAFEKGGSERVNLMSTGYTFIFNLLDYTAGIIPVTTVSPTLDAFPADYYSSPAYSDLNSIAKTAYLEYNAEKMKGLPVGVQIAGRRMDEERVLAGMGVVQKALKEHGVIFNPVLQETLR